MQLGVEVDHLISGTGKNFRVLVFPGGTEIGLEIHRALCQCKEVCLYSAGLDNSNHAPFIFARHYFLPIIHDPSWLDELNQLIENESIDYIFPAYDDVLVALAQNSSSINAKIVTSPLHTCLVTRSKSETYRLFKNVLPVPEIYQELEEVARYPVFVKPDRGQGSEGTQLVETREDLYRILKHKGLEHRKELVVMEHLAGEEYTIDCFSDREDGLLFCQARRRVRTKSGISMDSRPVHEDLFLSYADAISRKLAFHGAWFFQLKKDCDGTHKLLEIAPRIAGTMCLHRVLGINFPLLSIYEQERVPIQILKNSINVEVDRALVNRYRHNLTFSAVYVDLDDTLILNGKVNLDLVKFLYQCINSGKRLVLLTRHALDVDATLRRHRLREMFDQIIHVAHSGCKSDYVQERDAILIDDSFSERRRVFTRHGIPTFDCSMVEMLIDDRI